MVTVLVCCPGALAGLEEKLIGFDQALMVGAGAGAMTADRLFLLLFTMVVVGIGAPASV